MQIRVSEAMRAGDLVSVATGADGDTILLRWRFGCEAVGIAARHFKADEIVEFFPDRSTDDVLVKGSIGPARNRIVSLKSACDLKAEDLVCLRHRPGGQVLVDRWEFGQEAVGIAARNIKKDEVIEFCEGKSTNDIHVKPGYRTGNS